MPVRKPVRAPRSCSECGKRDDERVRVMKLLTGAIRKMEEKLEADDFKPSVGDFLKLMQIEKEIGQELAREIKVTWVEAPAESKVEK